MSRFVDNWKHQLGLESECLALWHYANEIHVCLRLSFQKLLQTRSICRNNMKKVWEKSNDTYSLLIRVQTTINHDKPHFGFVVYRNINVKEIVFIRARAEKGIARHIHASSMVWTGLLVGRGKKVKFCGIFRDKFAEKTADFAGILEASFAGKRLVKNGRFRESFPSKFRWKAIGFEESFQ